MIIVAEYIEYGDEPGYQPAFVQAVAFISETQVPDLFVASEEYLTWRWTEVATFKEYLRISNVRLTTAVDG